MEENDFEKRLWNAADHLRANSKLMPSQYSGPVLGLIFLKFADHKFQNAKKILSEKLKSNRRDIDESDYHARGVMYLPPRSRWSDLINLPEGADIGRELSNATEIIENANEELRGALPRNYSLIETSTLIELMRTFDNIPLDTEGDLFGRIFEYFLGNFAMAEGQGGGMFYTPSSIVRLIVAILNPTKGLILDPACGSGGMFVQSLRFIEKNNRNQNEISVYGMESIEQTVNLARMNLAIHQLSGQIKQANSYYEDPFNSLGKFDFVMANPPFNVDKIQKERLVSDKKRYPYGMPKADNGNYIWLQMILSALNSQGRAGVVMPNSACDARHSEELIRKCMIKDNVVDVIVSIANNFFYTVTLPCSLWFFDKNKANTPRKDSVLFIDATKIYRQIDRAHREFTEQQIELISNIVRIYKGQEPQFEYDSRDLFSSYFPTNEYMDTPGLCRSVGFAEIEGNGWSINPGVYVEPEIVNQLSNDELLAAVISAKREIEVINQKMETLDKNIQSSTDKLIEGMK